MFQKYEGEFNDRASVARQFEAGTGDRWTPEGFVVADDFPTNDQIIYAHYAAEGYEGYAFVLFERDGTLYEVHGSHCSCYGLEGQWKPEETTWAALAIRKNTWTGDTPEIVIRIAKERSEQPVSAAAVDPQARSTGTPTPRDAASS